MFGTKLFCLVRDWFYTCTNFGLRCSLLSAPVYDIVIDDTCELYAYGFREFVIVSDDYSVSFLSINNKEDLCLKANLITYCDESIRKWEAFEDLILDVSVKLLGTTNSYLPYTLDIYKYAYLKEATLRFNVPILTVEVGLHLSFIDMNTLQELFNFYNNRAKGIGFITVELNEPYECYILVGNLDKHNNLDRLKELFISIDYSDYEQYVLDFLQSYAILDIRYISDEDTKSIWEERLEDICRGYRKYYKNIKYSNMNEKLNKTSNLTFSQSGINYIRRISGLYYSSDYAKKLGCR